jgi:hypothetical protein
MWQSFSWSKNSLPFYETEVASSYSRGLVSDFYPEAVKSSPIPHILLLKSPCHKKVLLYGTGNKFYMPKWLF